MKPELSEQKLVVKVSEKEFIFQLYDTITTQKLIENVPFNGTTQTWGDEFYFPIPMSSKLDEFCTATPDVGTIAYWPTGRMFCTFYGPTPMSTDNQPVAASEVNLLGYLIDKDQIALLKTIQDGENVKVDLV